MSVPNRVTLWILSALAAVFINQPILHADGMNLAQLSGEVVYRERMAMPSGATVRVTLEDASWGDARATILGEQIIQAEGTVPVPFTLEYDADQIDPRFSYAPREQIRSADGKLLWTTSEHVGVLTQAYPLTDIRLMVHPVVGNTRQAPRILVFDCGGFELIVRNGPGEIAVWLPGRYTVLPQVRTASGTKFEGDGILFWSKGNEALLEIDGVRHENCTRNPKREPWADAEQRGVDFRAGGNEPGWHLEIIEGWQLQMVTDYGQRSVRMTQPEAQSIEGGQRYDTESEAHELLVEILNQPCHDTMSGDYFENSVTVTLDEVTYRGCGNYLEKRPSHRFLRLNPRDQAAGRPTPPSGL